MRWTFDNKTTRRSNHASLSCRGCRGEISAIHHGNTKTGAKLTEPLLDGVDWARTPVLAIITLKAQKNLDSFQSCLSVLVKWVFLLSHTVCISSEDKSVKNGNNLMTLIYLTNRSIFQQISQFLGQFILIRAIVLFRSFLSAFKATWSADLATRLSQRKTSITFPFSFVEMVNL